MTAFTAQHRLLPTSARDAAKAAIARMRALTGCEEISVRYGIPIVNQRIAVTAIAHVANGFAETDFVEIAYTLDRAAACVA